MHILIVDEYGKVVSAETPVDALAGSARFLPMGESEQAETYLPALAEVAIGYDPENVSIAFTKYGGAAAIRVHLSHDLVLAIAAQIKAHRPTQPC